MLFRDLVIRDLVIGVAVTALALSGCSKPSTTPERTTVTETVTKSSSATPGDTGSAAPAPGSGLTEPPSGATPLKSDESDGTLHARYSIADQSPRQVIDYYVGAWKDKGYNITGVESGGDPGPHGGSGASAYGLMAGTFVAVDAGAGSGRPTYFDVCQGTDSKVVRHCARHESGN